jgi:ADP-ribose pyrophosphatase YjhB (NUDIX family)
MRPHLDVTGGPHLAIRTCARALILQEQHVLAVGYRDATGLLFALPGGGQEWGEPLADTLVRECHEELGVAVEVGILAFVAEWINPDIPVHQIECIFHCVPRAPIAPAGGPHLDPGAVGLQWLPLEGMAGPNAIRLYPLAMRPLLSRFAAGAPGAPRYLGAAR